jgi:hypothetical protein
VGPPVQPGDIVDVELGYGAVGADDHLVFHLPWLDRMVTLARSGRGGPDAANVLRSVRPVFEGPVYTATSTL